MEKWDGFFRHFDEVSSHEENLGAEESRFPVPGDCVVWFPWIFPENLWSQHSQSHFADVDTALRIDLNTHWVHLWRTNMGHNWGSRSGSPTFWRGFCTYTLPPGFVSIPVIWRGLLWLMLKLLDMFLDRGWNYWLLLISLSFSGTHMCACTNTHTCALGTHHWGLRTHMVLLLCCRSLEMHWVKHGGRHSWMGNSSLTNEQLCNLGQISRLCQL